METARKVWYLKELFTTIFYNSRHLDFPILLSNFEQGMKF